MLPWVCSFAFGLVSGGLALKAPDTRAAATLPARSELCVACALLGGADRGAAPERQTESLEVNLSPVLGAFQVPDLTEIPRAKLPAGTSFWDPSQPLPGTFDPASVDPVFRTAYYDPSRGLLDVASAPWNLFTPVGSPPLFGGAPVHLTGFQEYPLPDWVTSVGG